MYMKWEYATINIFVPLRPLFSANYSFEDKIFSVFEDPMIDTELFMCFV
jgi:hypothetical protein